MTREEIVKLIENSLLKDEAKRALLTLIIDKGLTREVIDHIKETFDNDIIDSLKEAGVDITQTEEFKSAESEFAAVAEQAKAQLDSDMSGIESEMKKVQAEMGQQLDDLQAQVIKDKIAE
ncbi:hypothetical protein COV05_05030 [Candidatus Uhrbacteria bacterium CG10_big_fil_rev_8_21_14_0_10_48_16]|uniref:DUF1640 domain-containing protein n=1 Tax=Candidatus Uhrbacteria bacterium CG10_big_fil_rev_8_21_14_0_10_48_16 TaxID=1975038 RepID=A0A2M8LFY9_9BACT|nr:MAG: hypothetical protein COV05_05030 [Candidatus Uhrbacteria bacterium CG10_big_fil_rev_8_21_14_0_10_48_16]